MERFIDLSHVFEDGMPGFRMKSEDGSVIQYSARIRPFLTHEQSLPKYQGLASFEITELTLQTSIGTYLDSPYHRYPEAKDISGIRLDEVILPGVVIDARGRKGFEAVGPEVIPPGMDLRGRAVLFNFGWDRHWGREEYYCYPFISELLIRHLIEAGAKLVGVDTINIDSSQNPVRPAHSQLLKQEILIVENLTGLDQLHGETFRFFAVPWKAKGVAALPVRAFAEIDAE
jgi:arylformamidase